MSEANVQNPPWRHHFIPEFYLKRWCLGGTKLVQFSRPYGSKVKPKLLSPRETGFVDQLYSLKGLHPSVAERLEERYFNKIDGRAADAMERFHSDWNTPLATKERVAWTQFLVSMWTRNPEEIEATKRIYAENWGRTTRKLERRYEAARRPSDPPTLKEYLALTPKEYIERNAMMALAQRGGPRHTSLHIANMIWGSLSLPVWTEALMTSDRPVLRFLGLGAENAYIIMPIGPKHVFYAVNSPHVAQTLADYPAAKLAAEINTQIVEQAHRYAYATTDKPLPFVQEHLSVKPAPILAEGYKLFPGGQRIEPSELKRGKELRGRYRDSPI